MRRAALLFAAVSMLASCKLRSLTHMVAFEGEIDMSVDMVMPAIPSTNIKMEMKGDKARMETGAAIASSVSITDASKKKMWTLLPATRQYSEIDMSTLAAAAKASKAAKPKTTARKTGRSDKVAGYDCDVYEIDDPSRALAPTEVCIASGFSLLTLGLTGPFAGFAEDDDAWGDLFSHGFPLRMIMRDPKSGAPIIKMEATHIERRNVPDSEFEIPAGYTKL